MALWKQMLLSLGVIALGVTLWARYVPSSLPFLERIGLTEALGAIGIAQPAQQAASDVTLQPGGPPQGRSGGAGRAAGPSMASRVIAAAPGLAETNEKVTAIGTAEALRSVVVSPQIAGRLGDVAVRSGQRVTAGQVLAALEREAELIAVERAALVLADTQARNDRVRRLQASGAASDVQIRDADLALRQAELALRQAEFELDRRLIRAPIDGWVGIVSAEPGAQVTAGTEITRIDDRSALLVDFRLPERFVGQIGPGTSVSVRPLAREDLILQGSIDALDNRVDATSRTIRVQARIENADDGLRAGMAFAINVALAGQAYPSVDPLAIQWGREGSYVWVVREGKAARVSVRIIQRWADQVLVIADFAPGDLVIAEGVQRLRTGTAVEPSAAIEAAGGAESGVSSGPRSGQRPGQGREAGIEQRGAEGRGGPTGEARLGRPQGSVQ